MIKFYKNLVTAVLFFSTLSVSAQIIEASFKPLSSSDDAEQNLATGAIGLTSTDLELGGFDDSGNKKQIVGVRFPNVTLPAGASVISAYIQFTVDEAEPGANIAIKAQLGNAATYSSTTNNISSRSYTTSTAYWTAPDWDKVGDRTEAQRTVDLSSVITEALNAGFTSGNALAFKFEGDSNKKSAIAESYNGSASKSAELVIEYLEQPIEVKSLKDVLVINEVTGSGTLQNDNDWIELYNTSNEVINLEGVSVSDDIDEPFKFQLSSAYLNGASHKLIETEDYFSIKAKGETVYLFQTIDGETVLLDEFEGRATENNSYGRIPDGSSTIIDFYSGTPGASNNQDKQLLDLQFSQPRGLYMNQFSLTLSGSETIRYTTNFETPSRTEGTLYTGAININGNKVIKAFAYSANGESRVITNTYVVSSKTEYQQIPIASISTTGKGYTTKSKTEEACTFEFINKYGENDSHAVDAGYDVFGNFSARENKTNFRVKFKAEYGNKKFEHEVFEQEPWSDVKPATSFKALDFRTGQDASGSYGLGGTNMSEVVVRQQSRMAYGKDIHARYSHLFINGEYWGVYALRERFDEHFMDEYYGGKDEEYELTNGGDSTSSWPSASSDTWNQVKDVAKTDFQALKTMLNVDQFIKTMLVYFAQSNESEFRAASARDFGRAKLQLYLNDLDGSIRPNRNSGTYGKQSEHLRTSNGKGPGSLMYLANMGGRNLEYETMVKDRVRLLYEGDDPSVSILSVKGITKTINETRDHYRTFNALEFDKWGHTTSQEYESDVNAYLRDLPARVKDVLDFLDERELRHTHDYVSFSKQGGNISANTNVTISNPNFGTDVYYTIGGEDVVFDKAPSGIKYTQGQPLPLKEGVNVVKSRAYSNGNFGPLTEVTYTVASSLSITGINYNPSVEEPLDKNDFEFLLLTNNGNEDRDISQYAIKGINFKFPEGSIIEAYETIMIARSNEVYPELDYKRILWLTEEGVEPSRLSNGGEKLTLTTSDDTVLSAFEYDDKSPWPIEADGEGAYLKLKEEDLDNTNPENWEAIELPLPLGATLSNAEFNLNNAVALFPVPAKNELNIGLKTVYKTVKALIYDASGKTLLELKANNTKKMQLDISGLASGLYVLRLELDNNTVLKKVVKQ